MKIAVSTEDIENAVETTAETVASHTRFVGPDDPEEIEDFTVRDGDVWVEVDE